ncbi:MAG: glycosyltransferase family A protein [Bacteroidota bacterium]
MKQPIVSIILCTYNRKHLVGRAIASVFRQTCADWELVIVDDGSTDGSAKVLRAMASRDPRILHLRHANRGLALSRNAGVSASSGKYITFLDSDDELKPTHLQKRVRYLESHPYADALHGGLRSLGPRSKQYVADATRPGRKIHLSKCYVAGTLFMKRGAYRRLGGFGKVEYGDDYDFMQRLKKRYRLVRVSWPTYLYHLDSDNRLCDLYEEGGVAAIWKFRGKQG